MLRSKRRVSQMALADAAGTTQRVISFAETDRQTPGRGVVLRLAEALGLSPSETNLLAVAAGFAAPCEAQPLTEREAVLRDVVIGRQVAEHPYPALSTGADWIIRRMNAPAELSMPGAAVGSDLVELMLGPQFWTEATWSEVVWTLKERLLEDALHDPTGRLSAHLERVEILARKYPRPTRADFDPSAPILVVDNQIGALRLRFNVALQRFFTPYGDRADDERLVLYFPADEATSRWMNRLGFASGSGPLSTATARAFRSAAMDGSRPALSRSVGAIVYVSGRRPPDR